MKSYIYLYIDKGKYSRFLVLNNFLRDPFFDNS